LKKEDFHFQKHDWLMEGVREERHNNTNRRKEEIELRYEYWAILVMSQKEKDPKKVKKKKLPKTRSSGRGACLFKRVACKRGAEIRL